LSFKNKIRWRTTLPDKKGGEKLYKNVAINHYSFVNSEYIIDIWKDNVSYCRVYLDKETESNFVA
jgi:hypothetical protein